MARLIALLLCLYSVVLLGGLLSSLETASSVGNAMIGNMRTFEDQICSGNQSTALDDIAKNSSRKLAFLCSNSLQFKHVPPFWNETDLFLHLQEKRHELCYFDNWPHNLLFWDMLQLQLQPTGIRTPLAKRKIDRDAMEALQKAVLTLTHYFNHGYFLKKLKEIAGVPKPEYFLSCSSTPSYVSTMLLQHLYYRCEHTSSSCVCESPSKTTEKKLWISAITLYLDWNKNFVTPVQTAVIEALKNWVEALSGQELRSFAMYQFQLVPWLSQLSKQAFWVRGLGEKVSDIATIAESKTMTCDRPIISPVLMCGKEHCLRDFSVSPKQAALLLSQEGFTFANSLSNSEMFLLLYYSRPFYQDTTECQLSFIGNVMLPEYVTRHCIAIQQKREKVEFLQRVISICVHLKQLKDFHKLKVLVSAVRTSVSQTHLTHLTWKDLKMKYCKIFKELEDFMSPEDCYNTYLSHVRTLKSKYVPYFPAHRASILQNIRPANSVRLWPQCVLHHKHISYKKEGQFDETQLSHTLIDYYNKVHPFVHHMVKYCLM